MLKLKRVEIHGFKSFFDKTEMRFNGSGISAVVGPNGCGKSNLSDAISWVLGEQSAKSLRGARMEDVIFAGTRERKPLGMASVTMTLTDPQLHIDVPHVDAPRSDAPRPEGQEAKPRPEEVTITRRLFRSGESEYLINGRPARLRDIQDLFMGTGLGPESYAIIEQGRIGQILSNKPQDRRSVIEEAAGITRFKTRKRLAEAKLEGAKQNLTRVFDILEEVTRQVNSLKRQAAKAKRYEELKTEMVAQLRLALTNRYRTLERDAAKTALDLQAATTAHRAAAERLASQEVEHRSLQERFYQTEGELTEARKRLSEVRLDQERTRGKLESQARQIAAIETRLAQGETEVQELQSRILRQREELEAHTAALAELDQEAEAARERVNAKSAERENLQRLLQDRTRTLEAGRQQVLRLLGEASTLRNQLAQIDGYLASTERDSARVRKDEETAAADLERLAAVRAELSGRMSERQMELESIVDQKRAAEQELSGRKQLAADTRRELDAARTEASRIKARRDSLEEVLSHRAYTTESVKRLFKAIEKGQAPDLKPAGVLADFVEAAPAFEKAAEEFLHEELEYVVVKDWSDAERGIDLMQSDLDGRATFLVEPEEASSGIAALAPDSGILGRLSDQLRLTNGLAQAPAHLLPRLSGCYLVTDRAAAQRLAVLHPDLYFLAPEGISYHGHTVSGGKKTGSGPLALKRESRELSRQLDARQTAVAGTEALLEKVEKEIAQLQENLERLRGLQQAQEKEALALDHQHRQVADEFHRANTRLSVARLDLDRLAKESERATGRRRQSETALAEKEEARQMQEQALEASRAEMEELQQEAARLGEQHASMRAEQAGLEERRRSGRGARERFEHQLADLTNRRQNIEREMERLGAERTRLLSDNIELDTRAGRLDQESAGLESQVSALADQETVSRGALQAIEETLKELRASVQSLHETRSQIELELVRKQAELKYLEETSRKELNAPLEELARAEETVLDDSGLAETEARYQELRAKIEALGPVNPEAWKEFQEAQQRYDFLNAQRQDLLDSIRDTERAIHDIDAETRKRFAEAFEVINRNFREMFETLFGGGLAEMRLTDETNLAESGIDIIASPPGKKLQNVLLLSGGEKSLTAMALLMAIFRYQPSPFCILDEVDAPLDEANIVRLTNLIREMSSQTQFIVITHAKRTMESAQSLYGVTMQEPGVSKLVSVRFQAPPPPTPSPVQVHEARV